MFAVFCYFTTRILGASSVLKGSENSYGAKKKKFFN